MNKQDFINAIKRGALEGYRKYKVLPSLTMAQAILESGWGIHHIQNNLFGIKAGLSWKGKVAVRSTKEFVNGKWITVNAKFRAYDSFDESIEDHAKLLGTSNRYKPVKEAQNYKQACNAVWKCGYATDPNYPQKLIQLIEENKLHQYDDEKAKKENITAKQQEESLKSQLEDIKISLNGKDMKIKGICQNGTNYIPVRFLEDVGLKVNWDNKTKTVIIALDKIKIHFKGKEMFVDGIYQNATNYIPIRFLENAGLKVGWDNKNKMVVIE